MSGHAVIDVQREQEVTEHLNRGGCWVGKMWLPTQSVCGLFVRKTNNQFQGIALKLRMLISVAALNIELRATGVVIFKVYEDSSAQQMQRLPGDGHQEASLLP